MGGRLQQVIENLTRQGHENVHVHGGNAADSLRLFNGNGSMSWLLTQQGRLIAETASARQKRSH